MVSDRRDDETREQTTDISKGQSAQVPRDAPTADDTDSDDQDVDAEGAATSEGSFIGWKGEPGAIRDPSEEPDSGV